MLEKKCQDLKPNTCPSPGCAKAAAEHAETVAKHAAQHAAKHAVKDVFAILGVDVDVPKEVEAFREILRFIKRVKKAADRGTLTAIGTVTAMIIVYAVSRIWE